MSEISIVQYYVNGKKKYRYRFEIAPVNGQRKWKSKSGFDTKAAAMKDAREAQNVYERKGDIIEPSDMSYADFFALWLDAAPYKETTKVGYAKRGRLYIIPRIGGLRLKSIKRADLRDILIDMIDNGFARNTVSVVKGVIVKSFEFAVEEKYLIDSPAIGLKMPRIERPKVKPRTEPHIFITPEQIKQIFDRFPVGNQAHIPLLIGYSCGLRLGEVFALIWDDIDLDAKTLTVNRQVQWHQDAARTPEDKIAMNGLPSRGGSYWYFSAPKYGSVRTISMPENLVDVLRQELERQKRARKYYEEDYQHYYESDRKVINQNHDGKEIYFVIVREDGGYINSRSTQYTTKIIHEQVGIPDFDFHSLRHTHASMLAEAGAPANYVSHRLGHKNVSTTLNVYYHLTKTMTQNGDKYLNEKFKLP